MSWATLAHVLMLAAQEAEIYLKNTQHIKNLSQKYPTY
jgi:hypothetical protein